MFGLSSYELLGALLALLGYCWQQAVLHERVGIMFAWVESQKAKEETAQKEQRETDTRITVLEVHCGIRKGA